MTKNRMQPFVKADRSGFVGAEPFSDGSAPLIGHGLLVSDWSEADEQEHVRLEGPSDPFTVTIIVDKFGVWLGGVDCFMSLPLSDKRYIGWMIAENLLKREWTVIELQKLGFEKVNWS